ncbi:MAG: Kelch repeat-containing protein [Chthoniobacterales bacterium]
MSIPRDGHAAILLQNGQVLVAGGTSFINPPPTSAELYDPKTGTWSATGNAIAPFTKATLLQNGKVLATGGQNPTAQLYDPATGVWRSTGAPHPNRFSHTATLLRDGRVLIAGGFDTSGTEVALAEVYDPQSETWSPGGAMKTGRDHHTATVLANGKVLVAGGYIYTAGYSGERTLASAELYDPVRGTWSFTGDLNAARSDHTAASLPGGEVLVAGGGASATSELYNPLTEQWTVTGSLPNPLKGHSMTLLPSGNVLLVGGFALGPGPASNGTTALMFDLASRRWNTVGSVAAARASHSATLLPSGKVLIAGGAYGDGLASAELYDSSQLQNIATRLNVGIGDNVLIGGFIITGSPSKNVLLRASGPSLPITGTLIDPILELHLPNGNVVSNDNWKVNDATGQSQEAEISGTTIPPKNDAESAILATLPAGAYSAIVRGKNGATGQALIEAYDLDQSSSAQLANISTRAFVGAGDNVMIGGFILGPGITGAGKVLVRALGPSLQLADALSNPTLELHNSSGDKIASNDDWKKDSSTGSSQEAVIRETSIPPDNELESAIVATLPPGNYTAIVAGKGGDIGVGLVEAYSIQF